MLAVGAASAGWARALERAGVTAGVACWDPGVAPDRCDGGAAAPAGPWDLILVVDVCGRQPSAANERLLGRVAALARGGSLVVVSDPPAGPAPEAGSTWPLASYARWLTDAGFTDVRVEQGGDHAGVAVHAVLRPADAPEEAP